MQQLPNFQVSTHACVSSMCVSGVGQRSSIRGSSPGGRRAAMEREQAFVSPGSSAPASSNPIITSSASINSNSQGMTYVSSSVSSSVSASSRQQTLPQISVYGGIPDRQTVQVGCTIHTQVSAKLMSKRFPNSTTSDFMLELWFYTLILWFYQNEKLNAFGLSSAVSMFFLFLHIGGQLYV